MSSATEKIREFIAADEAKIRSHRVAIEEAEEAARSAASLEAGGGDPGEAERRLEEAQAKRSRHERQLEHLEGVIRARQADIAEAERQAARQAFENACAALERACAERHAASKSFATNVARCAKSLADLRKRRAALDQAFARAQDLVPEDIEVELPMADEPEWPAVLDEIAKTIKAGALRPLAEAARRAEKRQREQAKSDDEFIDQAVREALGRGRFVRCEGLSPELRLRALRRAEAIAPTLPIDESGPATEAVRARVDRLRELAAEPQALQEAVSV